MSFFWPTVAPLAALALAACASGGHELVVTPLTGGEPAVIAIHGKGNSGTAEATIGGRAYTGTWVYMAGPGQVRSGGAIVPTADGPRFMPTTQIVRSNSGNGQVLLQSADGASMRCLFDFSFATRTGVGGCRDSGGVEYALIVRQAAGK